MPNVCPTGLLCSHRSKTEGWNLKHLILAQYFLLWPPFLLLASRRSHQQDVLGWWSERVFALVCCGVFVMVVATVGVLWLVSRESRVSWVAERLARIRRRCVAAVVVGCLPVAAWFGIVCYLVVVPIPLTFRPFLCLMDLAAMVLLFETALLFANRAAEQRRELAKKLTLAAISSLLAVLAIEVLGNASGQSRYVAWNTNPRDLDIRFQMDDFDVRVLTNKQGLRERTEIGEKNSSVYRVVCIGDSYTFGWGVENDESYPKVAESVLKSRDSSMSVEVINMGKPGAPPSVYLDFVRNYASQLNPDLIVIGFLMGDDCPVFSPADLQSDEEVQQELAGYIADSHESPVRSLLLKSSMFRMMYGKLVPRLLRAEPIGAVGDPGPIYGEPNPLDPASLRFEISRSDDPAEAQRRYERLQKNGWVERGLRWRVNPWLVQAMILRPTGMADSLAVRRETRSQMEFEWKLCAELLMEMKSAAAGFDAEMIVLAVPTAHQVSEQWLEMLAKLGCEIPPEMTTSTIINEWMADFCLRNDLQLIDPLSRFRKESTAGEELFFTYDDHPTKKGYRLLGEELADALHNRISGETRDNSAPE